MSRSIGDRAQSGGLSPPLRAREYPRTPFAEGTGKKQALKVAFVYSGSSSVVTLWAPTAERLASHLRADTCSRLKAMEHLAVAKITPVHSTTRTISRPVFHDDGACKMLQRIKKEKIAPGTDDRVKCGHCKRLSR